MTDLVALSERVEAAIESGDWIEAAGLETERRAAIAALLEHAGRSAGSGREVRDALSGLLSRTQRMIGDVSHHRRQLLFDASAVRAGFTAANEYERIAGVGPEALTPNGDGSHGKS